MFATETIWPETLKYLPCGLTGKVPTPNPDTHLRRYELESTLISGTSIYITYQGRSQITLNHLGLSLQRGVIDGLQAQEGLENI